MREVIAVPLAKLHPAPSLSYEQLALVEMLGSSALPFELRVVGFSEEEGVRFGTPFIGSRALAGTLDDALLDKADPSGITVRQAIAAFGLNPSELAHAVVRGPVVGYLEFHIEQGPVLETLGVPLGIVDAIGPARRFFMRHAGGDIGKLPKLMKGEAA